MVVTLPPIRHVIAITAKDTPKRSAGEHDQTFFVFFLNVGGI